MTYEWAIAFGSLVATIGGIWFAAVKLRRTNGVTREEIRHLLDDRLAEYYTQMQGRIDRLEDRLQQHLDWHLGKKP